MSKLRETHYHTVFSRSEVFTETPSVLAIQSALWSDYKHPCTLEFLVAIMPNGAPFYVSQCYGGQATDKCIVQD